jgi:hypothetical protein
MFRKTSVIMLVAGLASAALPAFSQEETWRQEISALQRAPIYPVLAGVAAFGDQRSVEPFLKPLAPRGYVMVTARMPTSAWQLIAGLMRMH